MKKIVALGIFLSCRSLSAFEVTSQTRIVIADAPHKAEFSAARALSKDLGALVKAEPKVISVKDCDAGTNDIYFGIPATHTLLKNKEYLLRLPADKVDAISIVEDGGNLYIAGRDVPAAVSALFTFLTDHVGYRYFWPGKDGVYPPKNPKLSFKGLNVHSAPDFAYRQLGIMGNGGQSFLSTYNPWAVRNRVSTLCNSFSVKGTVLDAIENGGRCLHFGHTLCIRKRSKKELAKFCEERPDLFLLVGGKRYQKVPCWSSDEASRMVAEQFAAFSKEFGPTLFSMSAPDFMAQLCECERCRKRAYPDMSSAVHDFLARVITYTKELTPGIENKFGTLAYSSYIDYPKEGKLAPLDLPTLYCHYGRCYKHTLGDPKCSSNKDFPRKDFKAWLDKKVPMGIYGYEYDVFGINERAPTIRMTVIADTLRRYRKAGIGWYMTEAGEWQKYDPERFFETDWAGNRFNHYLEARLLWNADEDPETILRDWCDRIYGKGADTMFAYYKLLDEVWGGYNVHAGYVFNAIGPIAADMWSPDTIARAKTLLAKASKECAADARAARQVAGETEMFERDWISHYEKGMALKQSGSVVLPIGGKPWRLGAFKNLKGGASVPSKAAAWLSTDGKSLTIRLRFEEKTDALKTEVGKDNDEMLYGDDVIEIFFEPPTVVPGEYYHFVFNSKDVKLLAKGLGGMKFDRSFMCDWTVESEVTPDVWSATVTIPFGAFPQSPSPAEKPWKIGIVRTSSLKPGQMPICGWPVAQYHNLNALGNFKIMSQEAFDKETSKRLLFFGGGAEKNYAKGVLHEMASRGWKIEIPPTEAEFVDLLTDNDYGIIFYTGFRGYKKEDVTARGRFLPNEYAAIRMAIEKGARFLWDHAGQDGKWLSDPDLTLKGVGIDHKLNLKFTEIAPGKWSEKPNKMDRVFKQSVPTYGYLIDESGKKYKPLLTGVQDGKRFSPLMAAKIGKGFFFAGSLGMSMYDGFGMFGGKFPENSAMLLENLVENCKDQ